jgi:HIV Tat-specific factor 1
VAEDGKRYVFDADSKTYVTPEDKIEEELAALQESMAENGAGKGEAAKPTVKGGNQKDQEDAKTDGAEVQPTAAAVADVKPTDQADADAEAAKKRKKKKKKKSDKWKKSKSNTWVYMNGLPLDISVQEVHDHFAKCGVIQTDIATGEPRIKLYQSKESGGLNVRLTGLQRFLVMCQPDTVVCV